MSVNVHEAKTHLSRLLAQVEAGAEMVDDVMAQITDPETNVVVSAASIWEVEILRC